MKKIFLAMFSILLLITGCSKEGRINKNDSEKLVVYASFYPLYFLADEIGKENIDLRVVIPNGVESHDYDPSIKQLKEMEDAEVFIYNGAGFESWADKLLNTIVEDEKVLKASDEVNLIISDGGPDPHLWLNPENMNKIGEKIKDRFILLDEVNREKYEKNYKELSNRLKELDEKYLEILKDKKKNGVLVSHAAFAYMAEKYDFQQISVAGISPEQEPSPKTIANIIEIAKNGDFKYIFLETLSNPKTVDIIAEEANLETLVLNPIEGLTEEEVASGEDYISIMEKNLNNLAKELVR